MGREPSIGAGHRGNGATRWARLAVIECHARGAVVPAALQLERSERGALLRLAPGWAAAHPRTMYLLGQELQAWAKTGRLELQLDLPPGAGSWLAPKTPLASAPRGGVARLGRPGAG